MTTTIDSVTVFGTEAFDVTVTATVTGSGQPSSFEVHGFTDEGYARDARVRVTSALSEMGASVFGKNVVVQLKTEAPIVYGAFDLPIAAAVLVEMGRLSYVDVENAVLVGNMSLLGKLQHMRGALTCVLGYRNKHLGKATFVVPKQNTSECAAVRSASVIGLADLRQLTKRLANTVPDDLSQPKYQYDMIDVASGQLRRAMEIAAAGGHHMLLVGPPRSGRAMLAARMPSILPQMLAEEALEVSAIWSAANLIGPGESLVTTRPFRHPDHTASEAAVICGGNQNLVVPGEVALAHQGCLLLDNAPEFHHSVLRAIEEPMRTGEVRVYRKSAWNRMKANALVIVAMNPCPCGYRGDVQRKCSCSEEQVRSYRGRLPEQLLQQIDMRIAMSPADVMDMSRTACVCREASEGIRKRVSAARQLQLQRSKERPLPTLNSRLSQDDLEQRMNMTMKAGSVFSRWIQADQRSKHDVLALVRVARTIADLDGSDAIDGVHMSEATGALLVRV